MNTHRSNLYAHVGLQRVAFALVGLFVPACQSERDRGDEHGELTAGAAGEDGCEAGVRECADANDLTICEDNERLTLSCDDVCAEVGFQSSGCGDDACQCDGFLDDDCARGTAAACACFLWSGPVCSDDEFLHLYRACFHEEVDGDSAQCALSYIQGDSVDCKAVVTHCA